MQSRRQWVLTAWNNWGTSAGQVIPDLRHADLSEATLNGVMLSGADLRSADLSGAILDAATLSDADLRGAIFTDATLKRAILSGADLRKADLIDVDLSQADLSGAQLTECLLHAAVLRSCNAVEDMKFDEEA